jgi:nucleoside-diphosphate-sugar epimerase
MIWSAPQPLRSQRDGSALLHGVRAPRPPRHGPLQVRRPRQQGEHIRPIASTLIIPRWSRTRIWQTRGHDHDLLNLVRQGLEIQQFGDGSSSRDYTYIDDIVDGVVRSLDRPLGYQIFNLGNGRPSSLRDFIGLVERHVGKRAVVRVLPDQPGDVPRTCANIDKARALLGYEPKVPLEEGIRRTVEWYQGWRAGEERAKGELGRSE